MIYVFENQNNDASWALDDGSLTREQKERGIAVEQLPVQSTPDGKIARLKCRKSTNEVWWEYEDKPIDENAEIQALKADNQMLGQLVTDLELRLLSLEMGV